MTVNFTILTPWLPPRKTIKRTIECIDNQTYPHWQHLISVDRFGFEYPTFSTDKRQIISCPVEHNTWGNECRHMLWDYAAGDWIVYLDDDDILYPNCLERIAAHIEAYPGHEWGYFGIMMNGGFFLHYPPAGGSITGGQIFHRRVLTDGSEARWVNNNAYCGDWETIVKNFFEGDYPKYKPLVIQEFLGEMPKHGVGIIE